MRRTDTPTAFVSYAWSSGQHRDWVLDFCSALVGKGVSVAVDFWSLKPGHDVAAFMERMVLDGEVDHVIMLCDRTYKKKADRRTGGVGTEAQIVSSALYGQTRQTKFIPVILEADASDAMPIFVSHLLGIDLADRDLMGSGFRALLDVLHGSPTLTAPPLGQAPKKVGLYGSDVVHRTRGSSGWTMAMDAQSAGLQEWTAVESAHVLAMMYRLAAIGSSSTSILTEISAYGALAEALPVNGLLNWPNGKVARYSSGAWQYPSSRPALYSSGSWMYPGGKTAKYSSGAWQYPDGRSALYSNGSWQAPNGRSAGLVEIVAALSGHCEQRLVLDLARSKPRNDADVVRFIGVVWQHRGVWR